MSSKYKTSEGTLKTNFKHLNSKGTNLDTLVQLRTDTDYQLVTRGENQLQKLQKKARSKAISDAITLKLVDVKPMLYDRESVMNKTYWNAWHCNRVITQDGKTLTSNYCNTRHCLVCNRIRSAKAINGYTKPLMELDRKLWFVTLTRQSVKAEHLRLTINQMSKSFQNIQKNLKNTYKIKLKGIRKLETNYNHSKNTFNPHYHLVVGGGACEIILLKSLWLNQFDNSKADIQAQDIRLTNSDGLKELFKYFTKVLVNGKLYPQAMDTIFTAVRGKRTIQPFGGIKKVTEDVEDLESDEMDFLQNEINRWIYQDISFDWVNEYGEVLSGYNPDTKTTELIKEIENA